jgi:hypothetical protein
MAINSNKATGNVQGPASSVAGHIPTFADSSGHILLDSGLSNKVAQVVSTLSTGVNTGTTRIPIDDTIPQITEGDEYMTCTITPTSALSTLVIQVVICLSASAGASNVVALFQDTTANALAAVHAGTSSAAGWILVATLQHTMVAGTTSATTFRVRASCNSGTLTFNGTAGGRLFGAITKSSIVITEILP